MFDDLRPSIEDIIKQHPTGYFSIIKKQYPELTQHLKTLPYTETRESFYVWWQGGNITNSCLECSAPTKFECYKGKYRPYCSVSCKAKHLKSYKNAHDPAGKCKGVNKIKEMSVESTKKRNNTVLSERGKTLAQYSTEQRMQSYHNSLPNELKDAEFCKSFTGSWSNLARHLRVPFYSVQSAFKRFGISPPKKRRQYSADELEIVDFLISHGVDIVRNNRTILDNRQEIDIFIPSLNIGIEYCGLYWHSDRNGYSSSKHQKKFLTALSKGITLLTIFEDEWLFNRDVVKSRLLSAIHKNHTRIFARKCDVVVNKASVVSDCLTHWHIAGAKN
jgi:hypothetical protein